MMADLTPAERERLIDKTAEALAKKLYLDLIYEHRSWFRGNIARIAGNRLAEMMMQKDPE